jgi:hypothetical protein
MISIILLSFIFPVPYVSTEIDTGFATPIAYDIVSFSVYQNGEHGSDKRFSNTAFAADYPDHSFYCIQLIGGFQKALWILFASFAGFFTASAV